MPTSRRNFLKKTLAGAVTVGASPLLSSCASMPQPTVVAPGAPPPPLEGGGDLHVAMLQMISFGQQKEANAAKAEDFCRWAAERGADIALMPEMFNIGYHPFHGTDPADIARWQGLADPLDGPWVGRFVRLARQLNMAIAVCYLEAFPGAPRNSLTLIDRHGEIKFTYAKMHTTDFAAFEFVTTPGERVHVTQLDTAKGPVNVGAMICYDREFPETSRLNMIHGAELVLTPNACLLDDLRIAQFRVRALENSMMHAMANYPDGFNNGRSIGVDVSGGIVAEADGSEQILSAVFNLQGMRSYRRRTIWGDAYRRPHRYGDLVSQGPLDPVWIRESPLGGPYVRSTR